MLLRKLLPLLFLLNVAIGNAQNNNTVLWRINNPANGKVSYLFGTIHLPQEKFMQLTDSVYQAINNTNVFYGELNYATLYSDMIDDHDGYYKSKLKYLDSVQKTPGWKRMVSSINNRYHVNIDPDSMEQFSKFGQDLLKDYMASEPGVVALDIALAKYAIQMGKKTKGLETFRFQMDMMYKIIDARISDTTLLFNDEVALAANMKRFYEKQQMDSLTPIIESMNKNYRSIVFDKRNAAMADSIAKITVGNSAFFAVGCGHLVGTNGLISLLRAKGLRLTPVFGDKKLSITKLGIFMDNLKRTLKKELRKYKPADDAMPEEGVEEIKEEIIVTPPHLRHYTSPKDQPQKKQPLKKGKG